MDRETEARLKRKILANEELTPEEKRLFPNYDQWKQAHDRSRKDTIESLRWNTWPILFLCGFFLLSTGYQNTRYLLAAATAKPSVVATTVVSWLLGLASVVGALYMKRKAAALARRMAEADDPLPPEREE